ncbi:hypothetical protein [Salininema proteolyticum]|uniref:Uncharacterized protein n=1 Tax=Salininema proteolyticum TaxID=1607685 RepID=A0ABV8TXS8_9ACTN
MTVTQPSRRGRRTPPASSVSADLVAERTAIADGKRASQPEVGFRLAFLDYMARSVDVRSVGPFGASIRVIEPGGAEGTLGAVSWTGTQIHAIEWADTTVRYSLIPTASRIQQRLEEKIRAYLAGALWGAEVPEEFQDGFSRFYRPDVA